MEKIKKIGFVIMGVIIIVGLWVAFDYPLSYKVGSYIDIVYQGEKLKICIRKADFSIYYDHYATLYIVCFPDNKLLVLSYAELDAMHRQWKEIQKNKKEQKRRQDFLEDFKRGCP